MGFPDQQKSWPVPLKFEQLSWSRFQSIENKAYFQKKKKKKKNLNQFQMLVLIVLNCKMCWGWVELQSQGGIVHLKSLAFFKHYCVNLSLPTLFYHDSSNYSGNISPPTLLLLVYSLIYVCDIWILLLLCKQSWEIPLLDLPMHDS